MWKWRYFIPNINTCRFKKFSPLKTWKIRYDSNIKIKWSFWWINDKNWNLRHKRPHYYWILWKNIFLKYLYWGIYTACNNNARRSCCQKSSPRSNLITLCSFWIYWNRYKCVISGGCDLKYCCIWSVSRR